MTAGAEQPSQPLPGTVFNARQARMLKIAVVVMGVLLLGGFVVLVAAMVYQAARLGGSGSNAPVTLTVPAGAAVSHLALHGDRLALHVTGPDGTEILVLDLAGGGVIARVRLQPQ